MSDRFYIKNWIIKRCNERIIYDRKSNSDKNYNKALEIKAGLSNIFSPRLQEKYFMQHKESIFDLMTKSRNRNSASSWANKQAEYVNILNHCEKIQIEIQYRIMNIKCKN